MLLIIKYLNTALLTVADAFYTVLRVDVIFKIAVTGFKLSAIKMSLSWNKILTHFILLCLVLTDCIPALTLPTRLELLTVSSNSLVTMSYGLLPRTRMAVTIANNF